MSLHSRNRHQGHYNFHQLLKGSPELQAYVTLNPSKDLTINFADPKAVQALNQALLFDYYGITNWEIPKGYLCPPIPGRSDYVHSIADLLASCNEEKVPEGERVRVLDIGVGSSCIYPIIGACEYGWNFIGTDIDSVAIDSARKIVQSNEKLKNKIDLRLQRDSDSLLMGVIESNEEIDVCICNPPFHASLERAQAGSRRKWKNLGLAPKNKKGIIEAPKLNFGGQGRELWCPGGEAGFIRRMVKESAQYSKNILWFSTLISKEETVLGVYHDLNQAKVADIQTIDLAVGQKKSRVVAWTFLTPDERVQWRARRWAN